MKVPFLDLGAQYEMIGSEINEAISSVIKEKSFINGSFVREFECNFASFCEAKYCVAVGNGTDALFIALKALGIGMGDEVIVPANTFIASSEAVSLAGAKVVFVDCDPDTYNIDVGLLERVITNRTKCIIAVHLYGQPADMVKINKVAEKYGIKVIQDCAQAHGAMINSRPLSNYSEVQCYSFYPGKNLGAYGDAGAIVTNDGEIERKARMLANHGRISKYDHEFEGLNSRMDGIQGAILSVKIRYLPEWTEQRREIAEMYNECLGDIKQVVTPFVKNEMKHVYHLYVIRAEDRENLIVFLNDNAVSVGIHYPVALPNLKAYRYLEHKPIDFPVATNYEKCILSLPIYPEMPKEYINFICSKIREYYSK